MDIKSNNSNKNATYNHNSMVASAVPTDGAETCDQYYERLMSTRDARPTATRSARAAWVKWLSPMIGHVHVIIVSPRMLEAVRDKLEAEVQERIHQGVNQGISGNTARRIWGVLRMMFKAAAGGYDSRLRVRDDDPSVNIATPRGTPLRTKNILHSDEVEKLLSCEDVPAAWRRAYAIATYTYLRLGELRALTWKDVDFERALVSVGRKTPFARDVPIQPTLIPLLEAMHATRVSDDAPVLSILSRSSDDHHIGSQLRDHLKLAGVTRPCLFASTLVNIRVSFRSLRDTGIVWLVSAGATLVQVMHRTGHRCVETTSTYIAIAGRLSAPPSAPFPIIPQSLLVIERVLH